MANETDIIVRIKAEGADKFAKALKDAGVKVEKVGDEVKKTEKKATSSFKKIGAAVGAAFATQQLIQFTKQLTKVAVDLDATEKKFKTVFGSASNIVDKFAKQNATALGLTTSEYKKAAAAAGDLLIPLGFQRAEAAKLSSGLVNLSGALAAWSGGQFDAKQTADILTKALLGEREQLKSLGINIQEADVKQRLLEKGQNKLTGSTLAQAKATATLELIYEKSTDAQTAFADDTKTLAEQQLVAQANFLELRDTLAKKIIPIYGKLLQVINDIASASPAKALIQDLESQSKLELADTREALLLRQEELEVIRKKGEITFRQAVELRNTIPDALEEILRLEQETTKATASRGIGGSIGKKTLEQRQAEIAAAKAAAEEAKRLAAIAEAERLAKIGQEGSYDRILDKIKIQATLLNKLKPGAEWDIAKQKLDEYRKELEDFSDTIIARLLGDSLEKLESIEPIIKGIILGEDPEFTAQEIVTLSEDIVDRADEASNKARKEGAEQDKKDAEAEKNIKIRYANERITEVAKAQSDAFAFFTQIQSAESRILENKFKQGVISEKQYQRERAKLQEKQAKQEKAQALFNATINLATAITAAFTKGPLIGQILAGISVAAITAQIAAIAATPIPKFAKGTRKVGDGYEMGEDRTLAWLNSGERVVTTEDNKKHWKMLNALEDGDTDAMIKALAGYGVAVQFQADDLMDKLNRPLKSLKDIKANDKKVRLDLNPLLNASDRQRMTLGRKLDKIHEVLSKQSTHRMTRA